jgi:hypothetical protein
MSQATALEDTAKSLGLVNRHLQTVAQQSTIISTLFKGLSFLSAGWLASLTRTSQKVHDIGAILQDVVNNPLKSQVKDTMVLERTLENLRQSEYQGLMHALKRTDLTREDRELARTLLRDVKLRIQNTSHELTLTRLQNTAVQERNRAAQMHQNLQQINVKWALAYLVALKGALDTHQRMNQALIGTNSSLAERSKLVGEMFSAWGATGASLEVVRGAAAALVDRGQDLTGTFKQDIILVTQMEQALGMSAHSGAELVASFGKLGIDTRVVADGIARVVRDTALSADEAGRFAASLARAFAVLRPGTSQAAAQVSEYLLQVEGRLKAATGLTGEITAFYQRAATTAQGAAMAQMLGVDADQIANDPQSARALTEGLGRLIENSTRGMTNPSRLAALQAWSQQTGLSVQTLAQLTKAAQAANGAQDANVTIQKVWNQEVRNTGKAINQLIGSLASLGVQAFLPILKVINALLTPVAKFIGVLSQFKPLVIALQVAAVIALPLVISKTIQFGVALYGLSIQLQRAAASASALALAQNQGILGRLAGGGGAAAAGAASQGGWSFLRQSFTWLRPILGQIVTGIRAITLAAAAGAVAITVAIAVAGYFIAREGKKAVLAAQNALRAQYGAYAMEDRLKATLKSEAKTLAERGDFAGLQDLEKRYSSIRGNKIDKSQLATELDAVRRTVEEVAEAKFQREVRNQHGQVVEQRDVEHLKNLVDYSKRLYETNRDMSIADRTARRQAENEVEKKKQEERQRQLLNHQPAWQNMRLGY